MRVLVFLCLLANTAWAQTWSQFHADAASSGFAAVGTSQTLSRKWLTDVGPALYSSPVVAADGTVYVGTTEGELVAVSPAGTVLWRRPFADSTILATPAVAADGNVYVTTTRRNANGTFRSQLQKVSPAGVWLFSFVIPDGGVTTSSPKLWQSGQRTHVFFVANTSRGRELFVVDDRGLRIGREEIGQCGYVAGGLGFLSDLWDFLTFVFPTTEFDDSGVPLTDQLGWIDPTVALVRQPADDEIVAVTAHGCGVNAHLWRAGSFEYLWERSFSSRPRRSSSPAVFASGLLAIGAEDRQLRVYNARTGVELWHRDLGGPIVGTPASFGRQIFVTTLDKVFVFDSDGTEIVRRALPGPTIASPVLSGSRLYVSTRQGVVSYAFLLENRVRDARLHAGLSTPAVARDGTVYAMSQRELHAYSR